LVSPRRPLGEREVRGILPVSCINELENYVDPLAQGILEILALYRKLGTHAFNMAIFFDKAGNRNGFCAFCSLISRINPNQLSTSDSAFMERLHLEPVILTLPRISVNSTKKRKICDSLEFCNEFLLCDKCPVFLVSLTKDTVACLLKLSGFVTERCCNPHHLMSARDDRDVFLPFLGHEATLDVLACNRHGNLMGSTCFCKCEWIGEFTINSLVGGHDDLRELDCIALLPGLYLVG